MHVSVKTKADVVAALGEPLAKTVLGLRRKGSMKLLPFSITMVAEKPKFYLDDGSTLHGYAVVPATGQLFAKKYCGSNDSILMHAKDQLGEGGAPPSGTAVVFIEAMWNGKNMSWSVTVVSPDLMAQVGTEKRVV